MKTDKTPDVSVVTPSLNMLAYLRRCHASVVDQHGVQVEHIVKDGGSTDGTVQWLRDEDDLCYQVSEDEGMYDGINQGLDLASGDIIGYLNCDEQYLPGTLALVADYFGEHPSVDIVFGDVLLVDPEGELLAYRKAYPLRWSYVAASHLYALSCATFFRRKLLTKGLRFNKGYKSIGDQDFVMRALRRGYKASHIERYLSAFTLTGDNLSASPISRDEKERLRASLPAWVSWLYLPLNLLRLVEKSLSGAYQQQMPLAYELYTDDLAARTRFEATRSTPRWPDNQSRITTGTGVYLL